jgi:hypothetical protein
VDQLLESIVDITPEQAAHGWPGFAQLPLT